VLEEKWAPRSIVTNRAPGIRDAAWAANRYGASGSSLALMRGSQPPPGHCLSVTRMPAGAGRRMSTPRPPAWP
jgi:hypothetical protein